MSQRGMKPLNSLASLPPEIAAEMRSTPLISGLTLEHTASVASQGLTAVDHGICSLFVSGVAIRRHLCRSVDICAPKLGVCCFRDTVS